MLSRLFRLTRGPIATASIRTTGVLGFRLLFQTGHLIVLARLLGPSQFGIFAAAMASAMLLGKLANLGTQYPLLRTTAVDISSATSVLRYAIPTTVAAGTILLVFFLPAAYLLTSTQQDFGVWPLIAIAIAELVASPLITLIAMAQLGSGRIARSQLTQILPLGLRFLAALTLFIVQPHDPLQMYASLYLSTSAIAIVAIVCIKAITIPNINTWRKPSLAELREAIGFGIMEVTTTAPSEIDKAIAPYLLTPTLSGLYTVAGRTVGALPLPVTAMMLSALPRLFRAAVPGRDNILLLYTSLCAISYSIVLATTLWFLAPFIHHLFGPDYEYITNILRVFCFAVPATALRIVANNTLVSLSKPGLRTRCELLGITALVVGAFPLTQLFGVEGLALSFVICHWIIAASGFFSVYIETRTHFEKY